MWQFSKRFHFFFFFEVVVIDAWSRYFVELLSRFVRTHIIVPHISWHDLPCHITRRNTKIFRVWKLFCSPRWNSRLKHGSVIVHNICTYFIVFECIPSIHDQGKMLVLPNRLLYWEAVSTSYQCFVSFQPIVCHPHTQIRITLSHGPRRDISQLIIVLPKDDHTDSVREERLDLRYWTMT